MLVDRLPNRLCQTELGLAAIVDDPTGLVRVQRRLPESPSAARSGGVLSPTAGRASYTCVPSFLFSVRPHPILCSPPQSDSVRFLSSPEDE